MDSKSNGNRASKTEEKLFRRSRRHTCKSVEKIETALDGSQGSKQSGTHFRKSCRHVSKPQEKMEIAKVNRKETTSAVSADT